MRAPHLVFQGAPGAQRGVETFGRRRREAVEVEKISSSAGVGESH
jgi:hypothetical protein